MIRNVDIGSIEKWRTAEVICAGRSEGNPYTDCSITGYFKSFHEEKTVSGFYDGEGRYKVRFLPSFEEEYSFEIKGSFSEDIYQGSFRVISPSGNNHGMVRVAAGYHFAYSDGTSFYPFGTTCYVWQLQDGKLQKQTLETLGKGYFNKVRFCIFPKHYDYNFHEPVTYPYIGTPCDSSGITRENFMEFNGKAPGNDFDCSCFDAVHFRNLDRAVQILDAMGIEADLILMHPYDRWGFSMMTREQDELYLKYVTARYSAYKNVWWSLANEYDLMKDKTTADWETFARIICENDPYNHLRSIHNCGPFYDQSAPWITHCCLQRQDRFRTSEYTDEWRRRFGKPVIIDEIAYEGNIQHGWGNIGGRELVRRYWEAICRGGYVGHGETFLDEKDILWWSHGGILKGESPERIKFAREILEGLSAAGLAPAKFAWDETAACEESSLPVKSCYLFYYGFQRPSFREYYIDGKTRYRAELIDTWEMTRKEVGIFTGKFRVEMPGREYMLVLLTRC